MASPSAPSPLAWPLLALLAAVLAISGCAVRWDTPPAAIPTADDAERIRAQAVETSLVLAGALAPAGASAQEEALAEVLTAASRDAAAHADALGGRWTPPPRPDSSPSAPPAPQPGVLVGANAVEALIEAALEARSQAIEAQGSELAALLGSVALSRWSRAIDVSEALGDAADAQSETLDPVEAIPAGADPTALRLASLPQASAMTRALDAAGFGMEVLAARADGDERAALAARAQRLRASARAIADGAGLAGTTADPREIAYDVTTSLDSTVEQNAARIESELLAAWLVAGADAPAGARAVAWNAAAECLLVARGWGARLPGLPGLEPAVLP